jgi:hypothetical protein
MTGPRPSTLAEQVARAQATVASWPPEKRARMQLQGFDPFHERLQRENAPEAQRSPSARTMRSARAASPIPSVSNAPSNLGRLAFARMQEVCPKSEGAMVWEDLSDRVRDGWTDVAATIAAALCAADKSK